MANKKNNDSEITLKEASSLLDVSESTVKKYLKDFELSVEKGTGSKAIISKDTFQALSEITKLRANGLSIQEIKELKTQEPSKNILEEVDEVAEPKENTVSKSDLDFSSYIGSEMSEIKEEKESSVDVLDKPQEENLLEEVGEIADEESSGEEGQRKRRLFNYRYVERQISNDSKRITSLRLRLRNPNLPVRDRLFFEESLERRILFLDGWKHILRWISK